MRSDDDGLAGLPRARHSVPQKPPGHRIHPGGGLIQEDDWRATDKSHAGAQLPFVATAEWQMYTK